jgi:hypothetical protein
MLKDPMFKVFIAAIAGYAFVLSCYAYAAHPANPSLNEAAGLSQPLT